MQLKEFTKSSIRAGTGGTGRLYAAAGGGGAGGILINDLGPSGGNGAKPIGSKAVKDMAPVAEVGSSSRMNRILLKNFTAEATVLMASCTSNGF